MLRRRYVGDIEDSAESFGRTGCIVSKAHLPRETFHADDIAGLENKPRTIAAETNT